MQEIFIKLKLKFSNYLSEIYYITETLNIHDFVVLTIFLISILTRMKSKEKLVKEDNEIKLGPIPNCRVKYCWRAKSKL